MAEVLPEGLLDTTIHLRSDLYRNIVSIRVSQHLYDDLSDDPADWEAAIAVEVTCKPRDPFPVLNRAFDEDYLAAIDYPFSNRWTATRYSDGSFGVWYGSPELETTVHETVHHFRTQLADSGFDQDQLVVRERKVFLVAADAIVFDLRGKVAAMPQLVHPTDYGLTQAVGRAIAGNHPGLITRSARCAGDCVALFAAKYLSNNRDFCFLTYIYQPDTGAVRVQRTPGVDWLIVPQ